MFVSLQPSDAKLVQMALETNNDCTFRAVVQYVRDGWPRHEKDVEPELRWFWDEQDKISLVVGILAYGD